MSLRARVLAGSALIAVVLAVAALVIARTTESHLVDQVDRQLAGAAGPVRDSDFDGFGPPGGGPGGGDGSGGPSGPPDTHLSSVYVGHVTDNGSVETLSAPNLRGDDLPLPAIDGEEAETAAATGDAFTAGSERSDLRYRVLAYRDGPSDDVIVLALPLDDVDDAVTRLVAVEAAATAAILAVVALVAWWVVHLGVRPIKRMTATASAIAGGELSHRVPDADPRTEAGELGVALNQMLGRIETAFDERARSENRLRQFVADASHELRTPVTTIRGYAELYRTGGLEDRTELGEAMRRTEQEAVRMGSLVDDLLHLARLDQGRPLVRVPVDLAAVVDDSVRDARAVDPERAITASTSGPLLVSGDESRLRQVVANVVANALVHTSRGTAIDVRAAADDGVAVVEVRDAGAGMPPDVAARAFERFYRADPSRSRHRGGSGLGLSIVEATVHAHDGEVSLVTAPGRGTTVRITLPLADSFPGR